MKIAISILMVLGCYTIASAGEIFGTIKVDGKRVGKGVKLEITSAQKACSVQTDSYGSFRCFLQEKGKCKLTVHYEKDSPSLEIFSYAGSTRYDVILEKKDGHYVLRRK